MKMESIYGKIREGFNYVATIVGKSIIFTGIIMLLGYVWLYVGQEGVVIPRELFDLNNAITVAFLVWAGIICTMAIHDVETFTK